MASEWIKCTHQAGDKTVWVNFANALTIVDHKSGTRVAFLGGEKDVLDVKETPTEILKKLGEVHGAHRA